MTLTGCWRFTGTPKLNGLVTVGNNERMHLLPDSLLGGFMKTSEGWISETSLECLVIFLSVFHSEQRISETICATQT